MQPLLLGKLIRYFTSEPSISETEAYLYAMGMSLSVIILAIFHHPYFFTVQRIGMQIRVACCSLLYRKVFVFSAHWLPIFFFMGDVDSNSTTISLQLWKGHRCLIYISCKSFPLHISMSGVGSNSKTTSLIVKATSMLKMFLDVTIFWKVYVCNCFYISRLYG